MGEEMNEIQQAMLKNAGLLHDAADELVTAIEGRDYHRVSDYAALTKDMMYELSRLALAKLAESQKEEG